ncbi:MAG: hypothetical protein LBJ14_03920 [Desulfarculales bacterium]|jgi:hypothetical protein|nr:hypothetical protein [Desulfarculales bacterium]
MNKDWTLWDESGAAAITFTSFIDLDLRSRSQALAYPIEAGGFASYNKTDSPLDIRVSLAAQGSDSDFEYILARLEQYKRQAVKLAVVTPAALYQSMTLEKYSYKRSREAGAGMLTVELDLVEVREVITQAAATVITKPKNPTSADTVNNGRVEALLRYEILIGPN